MIFILSLFIQMASADWFNTWSLEGAFGATQQTIENPNSTDANYSGYAGQVMVAATFFKGENFNFGPNLKYFYAELDNKANTATMSEALRTYGVAPGLELRVSNFFVGYGYRIQRLAVELSGNFQNKISTRFETGEFNIGIEIPFDAWALRFYYSQSQESIPHADTGLSADSPRREQSVFLAIRYTFGASRPLSPWEVQREQRVKDDISSTPEDSMPRPYRRSFRQSYSDRTNIMND